MERSRRGGETQIVCGPSVVVLQDCRERFLVTGTGATALERKDPFSGETPLISQVQLGEFENAKRLLRTKSSLLETVQKG